MASNATWRVSTVEIAPNSIKDVFFHDSQPNAFFINNNNDADIYIGLSNTPTKDRYDVLLRRYRADTFGRPIPTNRLHILNDSAKRISITVYSAENMFDMSLLKNFNVDLEESLLANLQYDGIINGVKNGVKIPVEGDLEVTFPPDLTIESSVPPELLDGVSGIKQINSAIKTAVESTKLNTDTISSGIKLIYELVDIISQKESTSNAENFLTLDSSFIEEAVFLNPYPVRGNFCEIDFFINDSDEKIELDFYRKGVNSNKITVYPGESINDLHLNFEELDIYMYGKKKFRALLLARD